MSTPFRHAMQALPALFLWALTMGPVRADDGCREFDNLRDFAAKAITSGALGEAPPLLDGAGECSFGQSLSGRFLSCAWKHRYRSADASARFDALDRSIQDCLGPTARKTEDRPVNHPDTFALRQYALDGAELSVSIKDKAADRSSYVFLRIELRNSD